MQLLICRYCAIELVLMQAPGLHHQAAYAVALHRAAKLLLGNRKAHLHGRNIFAGRPQHPQVHYAYRKNRKRFPGVEKRINMLLALEPLICLECMANGV